MDTNMDDTLLSYNVFSMAFAHLHHNNEYNLPEEVVQNAVHEACDFLNMDDLEVVSAESTGVFTHNPCTLNDDILGFNRDQMLEMGVHDGNTLSLICTHEAAHCMLQYLSSTDELSNWEEELSCDAFMGVRAAVEGLDTSKVEDTLRDTSVSGTHPNGELRLHYIEIGKQIGEDLKSHDIPVTAENILARLKDYIKEDAEMIFKQEAIVNEHSQKPPVDPDDPKNYTQEEINRHISEAKLEIARQEGNMNHNLSLIRSKTSSGDSCVSERSNYESARRKYDDAKDELWKWEHMHPEPQKDFVEMEMNTVEGDAFHTYSSDVSSAMARVEVCQSRVNSLYGKMQSAKSNYGTNSGEYRQAKNAYDKAQSDLNDAREDYKRAVQDAHRMGTL